MNKEEKLADLLFHEINTSRNGEKKFNSNFNTWKAEVNATWNSRNVNDSITSQIPKFHISFENCSIKKAQFISLIARYDNYKLYGNSSPISDLLLQDPNARSLLKGRKASFKLKNRNHGAKIFTNRASALFWQDATRPTGCAYRDGAQVKRRLYCS